jgi:hypothetical protein
MVGRGRGRRQHRESQGDGRGTKRDGEESPGTKPRSSLAREEDRGKTQGDGGPEMVGRDLSRGNGRDDRPDRKAAAPAHVSEPSRDP